LTKEAISDCPDALDRIWSVEHWVNALDRVKYAALEEETPNHQLFELHFDAGGETIDKVMVARTRSKDRISVEHIVTPPGVERLTGAWWVEPETPGMLYAHRQMSMMAEYATAARARLIYTLLRENIVALLKNPTPQDVTAINSRELPQTRPLATQRRLK
jgi:hypothetical protein